MNRLTFSSPYPKQKDFLLSRARYIAYGGARGGGKSYGCTHEAELLCLRMTPFRCFSCAGRTRN